VIARALYALALAALLAGSVWSGTARMMGFIHRYKGEHALTHGEVDEAYADLVAATQWQEANATNWMMIGRVIHIAQSNAVRLTALKGKEPGEVAAESLAATIRGLHLNPSDAPAWFNVAQAYDAYHSARTRIDRLKAMVKAAQAGEDPAVARKEMDARNLSSEDLMIIASTLKASELEPEFSFYHDFLAKLYWDRGLLDDAGREIRQAFSMTPQLFAHPWITDTKFAGDLEEPILEGIDLAATNPFVDPLAARLARAEVFETVGRIADAIEVYKGLRLLGDPDVEKECLLRMGKLLLGEKDYEAGIRLLERLVELDGDRLRGSIAQYHLALAYSDLGDHEKAVQLFKRHLHRMVGSSTVLLSYAAELEAIGQDTEAEKIYIGLIERHEEDSRPFVKLVELLTRKRRYVEAMRYAQRLAEEIPDSNEADSLLEALRRSEE